MNSEIIKPVYIEYTKHLGTYSEIINAHNNISKKKLRVCFDLDNTLVTYPTVPNNYNTVKPIQHTINILNKLKNDGHEIIIYTARRMQTHNGNVGKVIKDIALVTINTLEKFNIHYDELIFGKPIADIYIDDRAINPYLNNINFFGLFTEKNEEQIIYNKINPNKYNSIERYDNIIYKTGPSTFTQGELYFYQNIPEILKDYFPKLITYNKMDTKIELQIEFINGIPLYYLYKNKLITNKIIDDLFNLLSKIHSCNSYSINVKDINIKNNYFEKLEHRFSNKSDYDFDDADKVYQNIINGLDKNYNAEIVNLIHGDFWFSNILLTYDDKYKLIDMKGQIDNILTLNGDKYYDYGKLYQSILGFDLYLNNNDINFNYLNDMNNYFIKKCEKIGLNIDYLRYVTKSLIFGTFHAINTSKQIKQNIWNLIKKI